MFCIYTFLMRFYPGFCLLTAKKLKIPRFFLFLAIAQTTEKSADYIIEPETTTQNFSSIFVNFKIKSLDFRLGANRIFSEFNKRKTAMCYGNAIQSGNQVIVSDKDGNMTRVFDGRLVSYVNGILTYYPVNASKTSMYVGL